MGALNLINPNVLRNDPASADIDTGFWDQFGKGLKSSVTGTHAGLRGMAGTAAEAMGADEFAQAEYQRARELQAQAQAEGPRVGSYTDVHGLRDAVSYGGGILGGSAPSLALGMGAGMVAKTALGGLAAGTLAQTPIEAADVALKQLNDPAAMEQGAGERFARQLGGGAASAGLQTIVPNIVGGKLMGRGAEQAATRSLKQIAGRNAMAIPEEGFFEGASEGVKQMAANNQNALNWDQIGENVVGGMVGGAPMAGAGFVGDATSRMAPQAREMLGSAKTSINERLAAAKGAAGEATDTAGETAPGKKVKSAWDDVSGLVQKGREKFDDTVSKVLNGEELGVNPSDWARATTDEAKRRLTELSDNEHVKAATKWADEMLADKGLDEAKRAEIMEGAKNLKDRAGQMAMAGLKKAWDVSKDGAAKVDDFVDTVKAEHEKAKRADVDVESRTVDEPAAELVKLGYARAPAAAESPTAPTEAPKTTIKDRKAFIDERMAEGMSKEEARTAFIESMSGPRMQPPDMPDMPKFSEDFSGANAAVAKAIQESGIASKRPELFGNNDSINKMAEALRIVAEQAVKGKLSEQVSNKMVDVFGKDAPHMINTITRVLAGENLDPAKTDKVFQSINALNEANKTRGDLHGFLRESMTEDAFKSNMARDLPKLADTLVKHARGELTKNSTPAEAQAINEAMAGVLEDHFGPNAAAVSKRLEEAAKQYGKPNMDRNGGSELDEEVLTDENGAEIEAADGGFDENGDRLDAAEQNITRYGLSKANVSGHQRSVVNGAMMHKDSQFTEKYLAKLKEKHSTLDDEGNVVRTAEENGYDIRFEPAEGSEYGHIVVEDRRDPDDFNADELARMKLDTKKYSKSASRIEVGAKKNAKGETVPEHILDATKIMDVLRGKSQQKMDRGTDTTVRQRMADGFAQGIATLNMKFGSEEHPIVVADSVVIGYVNSKPVTWGEARKLDTRTGADKLRDGDARRQEEIRAEFAKSKKITPDRAHNALIRAYQKDLESVGGDKAQVLPKLKEYVDLWQAHQKVLATELAGGRDTQEPSRLPASAAAPRARLGNAAEKARAGAMKKQDLARGATYTDNNSFSTEASDRKDADKSGNIHEAVAKGIKADDLVHRSNMDGSAHWAGADRGVGGLNTLTGTIISEWSKTSSAAAKALVKRVKRLVSVAASMSKADVERLRSLAPDPLVNRKGGPVDYGDRYSANDTLHESLAKMSEKQAMKELTRREGYYDAIENSFPKLAAIVADEIAALEGYIDTGKFGTGAGVQDSMTLGEAAPIINELARKYQDVVVAPDPASAGPVKPEAPLTGSTKYPKPIPENPIKFKNGEAVNGVKPAADPKAEPDDGHWEKRDGKNFWVEGTKSPKPQAPQGAASAKSGETKQSAQSTNPNINNAKNYNAQDIRDHIEKVLGKAVKLAWATFTHAGQFDRTKAGDIIRLSIHALDPMSTAYHESLHAFFAQLRDAGAKDIIDVLQKAASSQHVIDQLNDKFKHQPEVLKQLADPEERAAYMYQMWAADPKGFKVSIAAKTTFQKIAAFIRKVMGTWSNDERAAHIMNYFHEGKYARDMGSPSAVRHALMETHKSQILDTAKSFTEPLGKLADAMVGAGGERLRSTGIPALGSLADIIKRSSMTEGGDQGFIQAARIAATKMRTDLGDVLSDLNADQLRDTMEAMQANKPASTPEGRIAVRKLKHFLQDMHKYMKDAGVNLGNLGPDYFPRVWDTHYISKNQQAFRDMLEPYIRSGAMQGTADQLISRLVSRDGAELGIPSREVPQPGMQHTKERLLSFITPADAAQFVEKNLFATMSSYVSQAARKAEWARRMGGGKLEQLLADAKTQGATKEHLSLAEDYMKGVDGTLGDGMNPTARRLVGNMIVYQNVRLLPMAAFSMLIDPVGIVVRGGTVGDAWGAFKRGMQGITQTFNKDGGEANDQGTKWAELVGAVDTAMMSHVMGDVYSQGMVGGTAQKINNAFFKYNLVEGLNRNFRVGAVESAVRFLARHAGGLDGLGSSTHSKRWMRELGLRKGDIIKVGDHIALTEADGLTAEQVVRVHAAVNQWVDGAVLRPDAADKPIWMNDPHWALVAHLKQFVFTFQHVILGRVMHELKHGNYTPMMALGSYVPIMIAADTAKGLLQGGGDTPEWKKGWGVSDYVGYGVQRAGLLGVGQFGLDVAEDLHRGGTGVGALTGPAIEQLGDVLQTLGGKRSAGSTVLDALPANQLYKEMMSGGSDGGPMVTG